MRVWLMRRLFYGILVLLLFVGSVSALDPVNVGVTSSSDWVVANLADSAVITVHVTDGTGKAIKNAEVTLGVTDPWVLETSDGKTDGNGLFTSRFLPTLKSGTAVITAAVEVKKVTTVPVVQTFSQNINADTPADQVRSYPMAATIGSTTEISVLVRDAHGNPVDSRKKKENQVTFKTTLSGDNGFTDKKAAKKDKVKGISVPLDDTGTAATDFVLDTKPGANYVSIAPPAPLPPTLISIQGTPDEKPASITLTVLPEGNPPTLTTDGTSRFILEYQLGDQYGNPSARQDLSISTSAGEKMVVTSNNDGGVTVTYGPKQAAGKYTVTATAVKAPGVEVTRILQFASDDPTDMLLTASPQSMPSLDVNKKVVSSVMAKVIDTIGNPVQGQVVSFSIQSVAKGSFVQTSEPYIESGKARTAAGGAEITAISDENGHATVLFYPGAFTDKPKDPGYSTMAEGTAKVRARWSGVVHDIDLKYKNYPYLSVSTSMNPVTVDVGDEVEVSIRLRGDGYALMPKPVDVLLLNDRSGSMLEDYPDRMVVEMNAANLFSTKFDYTNDRLGLISFGTNGKATAKSNTNCGRDGDSGDDASYAKTNYKSDGKSYTDWATLDQGLSSKSKDIGTAISGLVPSGYTPMRSALYKGITEMKNAGRANAIKALVVMSDGDYNRFGDPLARGSAGSGDPNAYDDLDPDYVAFSGLASQSMAEYAKANGIRIYTIGYAADISGGGRGTLEQLATQTGGKYFYALTGDDLATVYSQIAGELKEAAGVNTRMNLDFQNVEVNGVSVPGSEVFEYVYREGESTHLVPPAPRAAWTENSEPAWNMNHQLSFNLGTIKVNEEWVVTFILKVVKSGNIKVLGANSEVVFDEGKGTLAIPDTYLTSIPQGTEGGLGSLTLRITGLEEAVPRKNERTADLRWHIAYNGNDEDIIEEIWVAPLNSAAFAYKGSTSAKKGDITGTYPLDISDLRPGIYRVRVTGSVDDAESSSDETEIIIGAVEQTPQILIR
jgi:hypothetical protein